MPEQKKTCCYHPEDEDCECDCHKKLKIEFNDMLNLSINYGVDVLDLLHMPYGELLALLNQFKKGTTHNLTFK